MCCTICSCFSFKVIKKYQNHNSFLDKKTICECNRCGMQFVNPMPLAKEWEKYNASYFLNAHGGNEISSWVINYNVGIAKIRLFSLIEYIELNDIKTKSVLEIGPGKGFLMEQWLNKFPNTNYYVVEGDKTVHNEILEKGGTIIQLNEVSNIGEVDLIIATHVLEHTLKPIEFMKKFCDVLRIGGAMFVETPCQDHLYKNLHEPHVQFFDKSNLKDCFNKLGFDNLRLTYNGDKISHIRVISIIKKVLIRLERILNIPLHLLMGDFWPNLMKFNLSKNEALAIVETSPHIEKTAKSRWVRCFGQKGVR